MIDQIFSNADYYLNKQFIMLMRNWNYYMNQEEIEDDKNLRQEIKNILVGDFYHLLLLPGSCNNSNFSLIL